MILPVRGSWFSKSRSFRAPRSLEKDPTGCGIFTSGPLVESGLLRRHRGLPRRRAALVELGNSGSVRVSAWLLRGLACLRTRHTRGSRRGRYCRSGLTSGIGSCRARAYQSRLGGSHGPVERGHLGHRAWRRSPSRYRRTHRQSTRSVPRLARLWHRADGAPTPPSDPICTCCCNTLASVSASDSVHPLQWLQISRSRRRGKHLRCFSTEHESGTPSFWSVRFKANGQTAHRRQAGAVSRRKLVEVSIVVDQNRRECPLESRQNEAAYRPSHCLASK